MTQIHPSAIVDARAELGTGVSIGPLCVIESDVTIGDGCTLASHVVVKDGTTLGANNQIAEAAVLGGRPQHLAAGDEIGLLVIGDDNEIREYVTIHRALDAAETTTIGDGNLLMINSHVGHDCQIGDRTIIANNVMLAGHVEVASQAYLSGAVGIHQFCRVGRLAMVSGQARIVQDVPPFVTVDGNTSRVVGLNSVGLRRSGFTRDERKQLKEAYQLIYRSGLTQDDTLASLAKSFSDGPAAEFHAFLQAGKRGFVQERREPRVSTIPMTPAQADASERRAA